ncbi:hypothetical protein [Streptosporangium carneum]|uniref:Uncharacterized protein n=1 Tax=Streptosporangium carneum TaxID=47481 RepID=A0A9W6HWV3_9ACTN|nr:hypothetical protein [Streptosporangium carneum]GLK07281.1 hypothetical protein GCM10017600_06860 [Streptosporangium carneum]
MSDSLSPALAAAVHLEIENLRRVDDDLRATQIAAVLDASRRSMNIPTHGDDLLFGGRHCVPTFAEMARVLACLAWQPGGVTVFGMHLCARHELCLAAESGRRTAS